MNKEAIEIANKYRKILESFGIPVQNIYIFGSYAKGTQNKWSDLDLGIVSPMFGVDRISERVFLMRIRDLQTNIIEPHPISIQAFNDKFNPFTLEIKKTGILV